VSELQLRWASYAGVKYACERWHYSRCVPTGKLVRIGVWEDDEFRGVVVFSRGSAPLLGRRYDLDATEVCELTRIALRCHDAPVSRIISLALRMLRRSSPGIRLVLSFADPARDHHGGVYQASNWIYDGESDRSIEILMDGAWRHVRGAYHEAKERGVIRDYGDAHVPGSNLRITRGKHRYLYPLDPELRPLLELRARPYPRPEVRA
jgi:hypothetical protein